jgi:hypothetical protein
MVELSAPTSAPPESCTFIRHAGNYVHSVNNVSKYWVFILHPPVPSAKILRYLKIFRLYAEHRYSKLVKPTILYFITHASTKQRGTRHLWGSTTGMSKPIPDAGTRYLLTIIVLASEITWTHFTRMEEVVTICWPQNDIHLLWFLSLLPMISSVCSRGKFDSIYFGLSTALDLDLCSLLLHKLNSSGVCTPYVNWFCCYLTNGPWYVRFWRWPFTLHWVAQCPSTLCLRDFVDHILSRVSMTKDGFLIGNWIY